MPRQQKIDNLKHYVKQWGKTVTLISQLRMILLKLQSKGFTLLDDAGDDMLQQRIRAVDEAVIQHKKILSRMKSLFGRASAGEDVWK